MRKSLVVVTLVLLFAFVAQFVFAAVGAFTRPGGDGAYVLHSVTGMMVIPVLILLTILIAVLAKAPGRLVGQASLTLGLVVLQPFIAMLARAFNDAAGTSTGVGLTIGGLHALNAIIVVHVAVGVHRAARKLAEPAPADPTPVGVREVEPA
ncbi:DUF6220 domain-containing protein [Plantactinospora sp. B5E13]|uniref:DUF6220 domain-containing protein n=1 Tax=unclassified Plantactinospora TaxID=2631981 RepID=UPI00325EACA5